MADHRTIPAALPVDMEQGKHGLFYVTSPVVRGLLVTGATEEDAIGKVSDALAELAAAKRGQSQPKA